jgi:hypothetical protein
MPAQWSTDPDDDGLNGCRGALVAGLFTLAVVAIITAFWWWLA